MKRYIPYLIILAQSCAKQGYAKTTTTVLANRFELSQQSTSRILVEMEKAELIERVASPEGVRITIKQKGRSILQDSYAKLESVFEKKAHTLTGYVTTGLGEGKYYLSLEPYKKQIKEKVGFTPYAGTLNLKVDPLKSEFFRSLLEQIQIEGFSTKERTFGGIKCYPVTLHKTEAALLVPDRTNHAPDIIEIIASRNLRALLNLKDNDEVTIKTKEV